MNQGPRGAAQGRRSHAAILVALTAGCGAPAATSPPPPPLAPVPDVLEVKQVCDGLLRRLVAHAEAEGRPVPPAERRRDTCVEDMTAERHEGEEHWRCLSTCLASIGAENPARDADACQSRCRLPDPALDCPRLLSADDLREELGARATLLPEHTESRTGACAVSYEVACGAVLLDTMVYPTGSAARAALADAKADGAPVTTAGALVTIAPPSTSRPFWVLTGAKRRVWFRISLDQSCDAKGLAKLGARVASHLR